MATSTKGDAVKPDSVKVDVVSEGTPKRSTINWKLLLVVLSITLLLGAGLGVVFYCRFAGSCRDGEKSPPPPPPSSMNLIGAWTSNYNNDITITSTTWYSKSSYGTSSYNIETWGDGWILAQNAATNTYNPSKWSIFHYHTSGSGYGFCQTIYDGASADAVLSADTSTLYDSADAAKGCGNFNGGSPHTIITSYSSPLIGAWTSNYNNAITVTSTTWTDVSSYGTSKYTIEAIGVGWILAQNAATNTYNPSKWSIFQFHTSGSGYGFCQTFYDGASAIAVLSADTSTLYDSADATTGCGSFNSPHTILTAA
jgi:hypothetical protein